MIEGLLLLPSTWLILVMIGVVIFGFRSNLSPAALVGLTLYVVSYIWANTFTFYEGEELRKNLYRFYLAGMLSIYCWCVVAAIMRPDLLRKYDVGALGIWIVLGAGESIQAWEFFTCRVINDPGEYVFGQGLSQYACGRILGWFTPYVSPLLTTAILIWIIARAWKTRSKNGRLSKST